MRYVSTDEIVKRLHKLDEEGFHMCMKDPMDHKAYDELTGRRNELRYMLQIATEVKPVSGLPASIQEAHNSGDGTDRP